MQSADSLGAEGVEAVVADLAEKHADELERRDKALQQLVHILRN
ncbi:MAG TPA: hypothetical protein VGB24_17910 [Longimicrobium sp.]